MRTTPFFATALLCTALSAPAFAGSKHHRHAAPDAPLQELSNTASAQEPGHGWRYFSNPDAHVAVVISPTGDYYYSRGKGLRWVAAAYAAQ